MVFIKLFPKDKIKKGQCPDICGQAFSIDINDGNLFYFKLIFTNKIEWIKILKSSKDPMGEFIDNAEFDPEDIETIKEIFRKHRSESLTCSCNFKN